MSLLPYSIVSIDPTRIGIVVLQSDETIERDMMQMRGTASGTRGVGVGSAYAHGNNDDAAVVGLLHAPTVVAPAAAAVPRAKSLPPPMAPGDVARVPVSCPTTPSG